MLFPHSASLVQKIIHEKARGILVVPEWTTKSWYTMVHKITVSTPLLFLVTDDVLSLHSSTLSRGISPTSGHVETANMQGAWNAY